MGPACHEKRVSHEGPGKAAKAAGPKLCPYSHPASQISSATSPGSPISASSDLCKTTPKHFKTMCRRPTPPGESLIHSRLIGVPSRCGSGVNTFPLISRRGLSLQRSPSAARPSSAAQQSHRPALAPSISPPAQSGLWPADPHPPAQLIFGCARPFHAPGTKPPRAPV